MHKVKLQLANVGQEFWIMLAPAGKNIKGEGKWSCYIPSFV